LIVPLLSACANDYVSLADIQQPAGAPAVAQVPASAPAAADHSVDIQKTAQAAVYLDTGENGSALLVSAPVTSGTGGKPLNAAVEVAPTPVVSEPAPLPVESAAASTAAELSINTVYTPYQYTIQPGDTLAGLSGRFGVPAAELISTQTLPASGRLEPGLQLTIPAKVTSPRYSARLLPDSELVFSPSALDFDIDSYIVNSGGYLATYREYLNSTGWISGAAIIRKVATDNSINPRLLLALLQYRSNWVLGQPADQAARDYPLGYQDSLKKGLYSQLTWAVNQLSYAYYGWREGTVTSYTFSDGTRQSASPDLNAGTFALQYLLSQLYTPEAFADAYQAAANLPALHQAMFGDAWARAAVYEPIFTDALTQPDLILPIEPGVEWSFTGGPHPAWGKQGALAAVDFAPSGASGCSASNDWVLAAASGIVARSGGGVVVMDLDGDGNEQTGWNLLYMHIANQDRPAVGTWLKQGDRLGHPSCEGGVSTGTHFHFARKYNGEWILAGGPLPFNLDGWIVAAGDEPYKGTLSRDGQVITACTCGTSETYIFRDNPAGN
jgi:murein DD-endopeptidase MepM/ murein hydrolase activator NlpD